MTGTTISGSTFSPISISNTALSPISVTGTISVTSGSYALLASNSTPADWTVVNSGSIITSRTAAQAALSLGRSGTYVALGVLLNKTDGLISATGTSAYGVQIWGPGSATNAVDATIMGAGGLVMHSSTAAVVNYGVILGTPTATNSTTPGSHSGVYEPSGGTVYNGPNGVIKGAIGVDLGNYQGAATVTNAGTLIGLSSIASGGPIYSVYFQSTLANELIVEPGAVFIGDIKTEGSLSQVTLAGTTAQSLGGFGTSITNFTALQFDNGSKWTVSGNVAGFDAFTNISGFTSTDTIEVTNFVATGSSVSTNELVLNGSAGSHVTLHIQGLTTGSTNIQFTTDTSDTFVTDVCFLAGARIAAERGEIAVEDLAIGDMVLTQRGETKPITWIGRGRVLATPGRRSAATPVIVRKDALADNVPHRDLHLTKGHSLYLDGALIPVEFLVNHRSIVWDDRAQEVEVYHIELANHDVLLANGAPAESYRDDGNRWLFQNANSGWDQRVMPPCAPVLTGGALVDAAWRRLLDRAEPRPSRPTTDEPDLHLLVDDKRIDGRAFGNGVHVFRLPKRCGSVRVASRAAAQDQLGIARDARLLGVALKRIVLWHGRQVTVMEADSELLCDGVHVFEPDSGFRWTDGCARLPASLFDGLDGACELELHVACTTQYPLIEEQTRIAA